MNVKIYSLKSGKALEDTLDLDESIFSIPYDDSFMSMYFTRMKKNNYIPTNKTKNISEISGTTKKPYKQKHTGNARQGSTRSAQMRGGGIAFGPRAVKANIKIPKGEAMLAKTMLLSRAVENNELFVIQKAQFSSIKTSSAKKILSNFGEANNIVIIHNDGVDANSLLAVRNIPGVRFVSSNMLTAFDLFYADKILIDVDTISVFKRVLNEEVCE